MEPQATYANGLDVPGLGFHVEITLKTTSLPIWTSNHINAPNGMTAFSFDELDELLTLCPSLSSAPERSFVLLILSAMGGAAAVAGSRYENHAKPLTFFLQAEDFEMGVVPRDR